MNVKKKEEFITPSQFYRNIRPEFFSDSKTISKVLLTKEQLAFEISQISTNQKHDSFETLCRRLAEKLITPNLIPQVGPTGGGDGKTDSETYPVSNYISERWFQSNNKWNENENWAFAMSAKKDWKPKVKSDVDKIIGTNRGYTKVYFFSNQKIRSKDKKETQDLINKNYKIELIILDAEWIIENVYSNHLLNDVIDSLNLSSLHLEEKVVGPNDLKRKEELFDIEERINNPNRTFEVDFQLVEDCLKSAILSRMIELPKNEVVGKFERAKRFVIKLDNLQQKIKIHYQLAWTYLNWYDDYKGFYQEFLEFKSLVNKEPNLSNLELYLNLYNLLTRISTIEEIKDYIGNNFSHDEKEFIKLLKECSKNQSKPSTALLCKFYLAIINISIKLKKRKSITNELINLQAYFKKSQNHSDIPFEQLKGIIDIYSELLPDNIEFDKLIDLIAKLESIRVSELSSAKIYLSRGTTKLKNNLNRESLVFFGKAVRKLAKEEVQDEFYFCLILLSDAYSRLGLYWAANNCLIIAINLYANEWFTKGKIDKRIYISLEKILKNEVILGRIPVLLSWYELFNIIKKYFDSEKKLDNDQMSIEELIDGCLSTRLLNTDYKNFHELSDLPEILDKHELWLSNGSVLYLLGYEEKIEIDKSKDSSFTKDSFKKFYNALANQPFAKQMAFQTNFLNSEDISFNTRVLGVDFIIKSNDDIQLIILGETILAYFESYLATAFENAFPLSEKIIISIKYQKLDDFFKIKSASKNSFILFIKQDYSYKSKDILGLMEEFLPLIIGKNYLFKDYNKFFENLYKNDEVNERLSLIFRHKNSLTNILTSKPKFFLKNWKNEKTTNYILKRKSNPIELKVSKLNLKSEKKINEKTFFNSVTHQNFKAQTVIDAELWDKAKWKGFGFLKLPSNNTLGIVLAFQNEDAGKKIFENWINEYGAIDTNDEICITIIKGIRKKNPYWYKILINKFMDIDNMKEGQFISSSSRFHMMEPKNDINLKNLIKGFEFFNNYTLIPAFIDKNYDMKPFFELGIQKSKLKIIDAWKIGIHNPERVVITDDDEPIIPSNIDNAPILELLKEKRNKK
ncbi:hypothetical protein F7018_03915 [Tenacibaculum aiptasiae]|uniref:Uncharacterized protein n=1 Tax=Tenacibaculum aiptasiae TaxID=426481 RepID=A0A7J5APC8_9FLAO|nr:hypothetical protein [Tenacibaculum aiptasiae]KAB1159468.1 hypothetical protein F7018_03915 [Tenacibaculum aiptasiae]